MVGAMLVFDGQVIGENYHRRFGEGHAEANVIADVLQNYGEEKARMLLKESTLYVTLEPCSHFGKTPPCANLILEYQIPKVVVALGDPTDKVDGKGIALLRQNGVEVITGVCQNDATWLNRRFLLHSTQQRPYIILKWAQTHDGFFAPENGKEQKWITGPVAKMLAHRWRSEEDAILVGKGTALADNPSLTVREWSGRNPKRILIDRNLEVPGESALFSGAAETIVINSIKTDVQGTTKWIDVEQLEYYMPQKVAFQLYLLDIQSVMIEGGAHILSMFLDAGLFDEIRILKSPHTWGRGIAAPPLPSDCVPVSRYLAGEDEVLIFKYGKF